MSENPELGKNIRQPEEGPPPDGYSPDNERDDYEDDAQLVALRETTHLILAQLGHVGVPRAVMQEVMRQDQAAESIANLLQLRPITEEQEVQASEASLKISTENRLLRAENPALKIQCEDTSKFVAGMCEPPKVKTERQPANHANFWTAVRELEPYEYSALRKVELAMTAEPYTGAAELSMVVSFRPSAFVSTMGLMKLASIKNGIDRYYPFFPADDQDEATPKQYLVDPLRGQYSEAYEGGVGVHWETDDPTETVTVELTGLNVVLRRRFKGQKVEFTDDGEPTLQAYRQSLLEDRVNALTESTYGPLPIYLELLLQQWVEEPLPELEFEAKPNYRAGFGSLSEIAAQRKKDQLQDIPPEITDERQRELYLKLCQPRPDVRFTMIGGLEQEKKLTQRLVNRAKNPEQYADAGLTPKATGLFVGPPGCGKTMLAQAAAHEMDGIYLAAKVSDIESMWAGEAEKNVQAMFALLKTLSVSHKVVLFIDELEGLASSRSNQHMMNWERKMTTEFLSALNESYPNCLILGATNDGGHVDPAVSRSGRFNEIIEIDPPDESGRREIIEKWMSYFSTKAKHQIFGDVDVELLVSESEDLSGADLKNGIERVISDAVDEATETGEGFVQIPTTSLAASLEGIKTNNQLRYESYI